MRWLTKERDCGGACRGWRRLDSQNGNEGCEGDPPRVFCKNVILGRLDARDAQECESRGVSGECKFEEEASAEKEGDTEGRLQFTEYGSTELQVCQ